MRVVILGIGSAQVDAIEYARAQGWEVHGLGYRDEGPGRRLVDHFGLVDIVDRAAVRAYAERVRADLVYSVGSDVAMPSVGGASEDLGLPFFVAEPQARTLLHKGRLRSYLQARGISPVRFMLGAQIADFDTWTTYPAIAKPVDSQGQRGVREIWNRADLERCVGAALAQSRMGQAIVEEYLDGPEISVNAFVRHGVVQYAVVTDRLVVDGAPGGIVRAHRLPSRLAGDGQQNARDLASRCIRALAIENGPVYFQMKAQGNRLCVLEIAPRLDGCHLWRLIRHACGLDLLDLTFSCLAGTPPAPRTQPQDGEWLLEFAQQRPGTPAAAPFAAHPRAVFSAHYYREGEVVRPINGHLEKTGYQIYRADLDEAAAEAGRVA